MNATSCPNREELAAYLLGRLPKPEAEIVEEHLASCTTCEVTVASMDGIADTVVAGLRQRPAEDPYTDEPEYRRALAELQALHAAEDVPGRTEQSGASTPEPAVLGELGEYQLLEKLGEGGMGAVYRARQTKLKRIVALKVLPKSRMEEKRAVARFEREMEAVGAVDHPNIVRAMDAREIDGAHFLVMEYVEGLDLAEVVRRLGPLAIGDACELIRQAAQGLQCAHENGLVHRDIKPSNLMLTAQGQVKILDLGLALLNVDQPNGQEMTGSGQAMGTADYMAPEQATDSHNVDIRADIYGLGCTLYRLLIGRAPFSDPKYRTTFDKMTAHIREEIPSMRRFRTDLPQELSGVVERMLAKDPAERYATPAEVAAALEPFAAGCDLSTLIAQAQHVEESVGEMGASPAATDELRSSALAGTQPGQIPEAPPAPLPQRRRWKPLKVAVGITMAALGLVLALGIVIHIRDRSGRETALEVPDRSEVRIGEDGQVEVTLPEGTKVPDVPPTQPEKPVAVPKRVTVKIAPEPLELAEGAALSRTALVAEPAEIPGIRSWTVETRAHRGAVHAVAYRPDGQFLATGCEDGVVRLWDPGTGWFVLALVGHEGGVHSLAWSPDGEVLASGSADKTIRFWDPRSGRTLRVVRELPEAVDCTAWSPEGRTLASATRDGTVYLWDITSGKPLHVFRAHEKPLVSLTWLPDARTLATASSDNTLKLWDTRTGTLQRTVNPPGDGSCPPAVSPDGKTLAMAWRHSKRSDGEDISVELVDIETGELRRKLATAEFKWHCYELYELVWSPDGKTLCLRGRFYRQHRPVWDVETGRLLWSLCEMRWGYHMKLLEAVYSPDGKTLAFACGDGAMQLCQTRSKKLLHALPAHTAETVCVAFSPDTETLASGYPVRAEVRLWNTDSGELLKTATFCGDRRLGAHHLALSGDGKLAVNNHISDAGMSKFRALKLPGVFPMTWSPDGRAVAFGQAGTVWDAASGKLIMELKVAHGNHGAPPTWSPDGEFLAVIDHHRIQIRDPESWQVLKTFQGVASPGLSEMVSALAWSPDGKTLAAGRTDNKLLLLDMESQKLRAIWEAHENPPVSLAWRPDGKALVSGSSSEVCVWDVRMHKRVSTIHDDGGAISADGRLVASRGQSSIRLRRTADGQLLRTMVSLRDDQYAVISPDGHWRGSPEVQEE